TTARRYAAQTEVQRKFANWLRTFIGLMRNPLSPGYGPERLDRELRLPEPPAPRLAMGTEDWKAEHGAQFAKHLVTKRPPAQGTFRGRERPELLSAVRDGRASRVQTTRPA